MSRHFYLLLCFFLPLFGKELVMKGKNTRTMLHALLICDDSPHSGLTKETHVDIENMRAFLKKVAKTTKLRVKIHNLSGKKTTYNNVLYWVKSLPNKRNQIFFCYFAGHGYRPETNKSPWPYCSLPNHSTHITHEWMLSELKKHNPRLSIILSDCCNSTDLSESVFAEKRHSKSKKNKKCKGLNHLFLATRGTIIGTAASPGQPAFCSRQIGGLFTRSFLDAILSSSSHKYLSWKHVATITQTQCEPLQKPFFSISLQNHP